jgi:hypothetical protein
VQRVCEFCVQREVLRCVCFHTILMLNIGCGVSVYVRCTSSADELPQRGFSAGEIFAVKSSSTVRRQSGGGRLILQLRLSGSLSLGGFIWGNEIKRPMRHKYSKFFLS